MAERDRKVSTEDLMTKYVPEWNKADTKDIKVDHIMRHCSGRKPLVEKREYAGDFVVRTHLRILVVVPDVDRRSRLPSPRRGQ